MSKGLSTDSATTDLDASTLEDESLGTVQEAVPVPLFAGKCKLAGRYGSPIYDQTSKPAKTSQPTKK